MGVLLSRANAYSPAQTCAIVQTNTFIADPTDCSGYYYCVDGAISFQGNCGPGLSYNSYTGSCDYSSNVKCNFGQSICQNVAATYKADPLSCSTYIYCDGKGNTLRNECPAGQDFSLELKSCVWATPNSCSGNPCDLVPNNKFVAFGTTNEPSCTSPIYRSMTCYQGKGFPHECPCDYIYNSIEGQCDYDPTANVNVDPCKTKVAGTNFAASSTNCNQYYYCPPSPSTDPPTKLKCPQRFHFNAITGTCVYAWEYVPSGANGKCDRCGGFTNGYFVDANSSCQSYKFCIAGDDGDGATNKAQPSASCSDPNYPYFNESSQTCVSTKPTTAFCNPPPASS